MKKLSLHFADELAAAGLAEGVAFSFDGEIFCNEGVDRAAVEALAAAHDPDAVFTPRARTTPMWRARTIMKQTPFANGTLFDAVTTAITTLAPDMRAAAEEVFERGDIFDMDGQFVPVLAFMLGVTEEMMLELIELANELPA